MKILYTSPSIDPILEKRHFLPVGINLQELGHDLLWLVPKYHKNRPKNFKLKTIFLPTLRQGSFLSYLVTEFLRFIYLPFLILKFQPDILYNRKEKFDLGVAFWAYLLGLPYVVEVNGYLEKEFKQGGYSEFAIKIFKAVEVITYKLASRIICVTDGVGNWLIKNFKIKKSKIAVIYNGADIKIFQPLNKKNCRKKIDISADMFYVGFVGFFAKWQDLETLINAMALIKNSVYCILLGSGWNENKLRQMVKKMNLEDRVRFIDWVDYEKVPLYIGAFDVCYVSRMGMGSGFSPLKLYEYLACARPVIGARIQGIADVIKQGKCGFLFESGDTQELSKIIIRCFKNRSKLRQLGLNGRKLIEKKYSWYNTAQKINKIFHEI